MGQLASMKKSRRKQSLTPKMPELAMGKPTKQIGTTHGGDAARAVDGKTSGNWAHNSCTHTTTANKAWWEVDLQKKQAIGAVVLWNRSDCCGNRLNDVQVYADGQLCGHIGKAGKRNTIDCGGKQARRVKVQLRNTGILTLCEVQIRGCINHLTAHDEGSPARCTTTKCDTA